MSSAVMSALSWDISIENNNSIVVKNRTTNEIRCFSQEKIEQELRKLVSSCNGNEFALATKVAALGRTNDALSQAIYGAAIQIACDGYYRQLTDDLRHAQ